MKYKGKVVIDFSIGVELGKDKTGNKLEDFKSNEKFVADKLRHNGIHGWDYTEAPVDDLVIISPVNCNFETVNKLFYDIKKLFENVTIQVLYDEFDENGSNLEELDDYLKNELFECK